jgi:hypothetical protein
MYDIRLINPLRQYETVCWTLLFEDPAGGLPSLRVEKKYDEAMTSDDICADISACLVAMLFEATRPPVEYDENGEPLPQGDGVTVDLAGETVNVDDVGGVVYEWQL